MGLLLRNRKADAMARSVTRFKADLNQAVKGIPITKFCDLERLTPRERLELFIPVCQAVQHAHQ
jgi:hypothetical protein